VAWRWWRGLAAGVLHSEGAARAHRDLFYSGHFFSVTNLIRSPIHSKGSFVQLKKRHLFCAELKTSSSLAWNSVLTHPLLYAVYNCTGSPGRHSACIPST
jgi:hypothetical protein